MPECLLYLIYIMQIHCFYGTPFVDKEIKQILQYKPDLMRIFASE